MRRCLNAPPQRCKSACGPLPMTGWREGCRWATGACRLEHSCPISRPVGQGVQDKGEAGPGFGSAINGRAAASQVFRPDHQVALLQGITPRQLALGDRLKALPMRLEQLAVAQPVAHLGLLLFQCLERLPGDSHVDRPRLVALAELSMETDASAFPVQAGRVSKPPHSPDWL